MIINICHKAAISGVLLINVFEIENNCSHQQNMSRLRTIWLPNDIHVCQFIWLIDVLVHVWLTTKGGFVKPPTKLGRVRERGPDVMVAVVTREHSTLYTDTALHGWNLLCRLMRMAEVNPVCKEYYVTLILHHTPSKQRETAYCRPLNVARATLIMKNIQCYANQWESLNLCKWHQSVSYTNVNVALT